MRAAVCRAFGEPLVLESLELADPGPGEVRVRVGSCAVCASDIHAMRGAWGGELPAVYGHEAAGVVEGLGPDVHGVAPGDRVVVTLLRSCGRCHYCALGTPTACEGTFALAAESRLRDASGASVAQGIATGGFAERVVVHASQVVPVPGELGVEVASLLACGVLTGVGAVTNAAQVPPGASVVVVGVGGVGVNVVQGARLAGADPIVALDVAPAKLELARTFGATHAALADSPDLTGIVRACTGGRGADYVMVAVGIPGAVEQGLALLSRAGTLVLVGMPDHGVDAHVPVAQFAHAGQRIIGTRLGSSRPAVDVPRLVAAYRARRLRLDELITGRFGLEEINEAVASTRAPGTLRSVVIP